MELIIAISGGLTAMLAWGTSDALAKKGLDKLNSLTVTLYVNIFIFLVSFLNLFLGVGEINITFQDVVVIFIFEIFQLIAAVSMYKAFSVGKISIMAPIIVCYSVINPIANSLIFGVTISPIVYSVILIIFIGIVFLSIDFKDLKDGIQPKDLVKGLPYALLSMIIWGIMLPFWDRFLDRSEWNVLVVLCAGVLVIMNIVLNLVLKVPFKVKNENGLLRNVILTGILFGVGNVAVNASFAFTQTLTSTIIVLSAASPLVTMILGYLFLKEKLSINQYIGSGIVILGIILLPIVLS